jgi:prevent-host-death family protein
MLEEIGSYDAKTKLPEILRRVESGEGFTITNRGKPVADLVPSEAQTRTKAVLAVENILKMKKHTITDKELAALKSQGRK